MLIRRIGIKFVVMFFFLSFIQYQFIYVESNEKLVKLQQAMWEEFAK